MIQNVSHIFGRTVHEVKILGAHQNLVRVRPELVQLGLDPPPLLGLPGQAALLQRLQAAQGQRLEARPPDGVVAGVAPHRGGPGEGHAE